MYRVAPTGRIFWNARSIGLAKARFGVLAKWKQTMCQPGLKVARLQPRIVRCCARHIIERKEIGNVKLKSF